MGPSLHDLFLVSFTFFVFSLFSFATSAPAPTLHAVPSTARSTFVPSHVAFASMPMKITHDGSNTSGTSYSFATQLPMASVALHSTPTFVVRQLDNSTIIQQSSAATSSTPTAVVFFMDSADTLSSRVLVSIIIGFMIFVGCYVSFCCVWRCNRRPQPQSLPPPAPARRARPTRMPSLHLVIGVTRTAVRTWTTPTSTATSSQRLSSVSDATLTPGSGDRPSAENTKYSIEQGPESAGVGDIEMIVPPTPPPVALSRASV
ncbi:hypothetical protein C8R45DRAFT_593460 [Mycena sanguinolenta]|nr:hypothetical protein C8R45DRAFT_593460 [Mycena sanguinolenta]